MIKLERTRTKGESDVVWLLHKCNHVTQVPADGESGGGGGGGGHIRCPELHHLLGLHLHEWSRDVNSNPVMISTSTESFKILWQFYSFLYRGFEMWPGDAWWRLDWEVWMNVFAAPTPPGLLSPHPGGHVGGDGVSWDWVTPRTLARPPGLHHW